MSAPGPAGDPREIPAALAERLFPEVLREDLTLASSSGGSRSLVIARLLEDGDRADLGWLFGALPEEEIAVWLGEHGARKLSRRSAAYWQVVLGVSSGAPAEIRADLWPL